MYLVYNELIVHISGQKRYMYSRNGACKSAYPNRKYILNSRPIKKISPECIKQQEGRKTLKNLSSYRGKSLKMFISKSA